MPRNYDDIDLDFTWDGDYITDETGDLKDTSYDLLQSLKNQILLRIKSDLNDWREDPNVGADLGDYIGEPNNQTTAKSMSARIRGSVLDVIAASDIDVRIVPISSYRVLIKLNVQVLSTPDNRLQPGNTVTIDFIYDYFERGVFVPLDDLNKFSGRQI